MTHVRPERASRALLMGKRVLLAEDEPMVSLEIEDVLLETGAELIGPFADLGALMEAAERVRIDAAILDVRLGRADSFPAADLLARRGVPFVFHSGHVSRETIARAYPEARLVQKPCTPEMLLDTLAARLA